LALLIDVTASAVSTVPYTGTWYNLMDNSTINVNTSSPISVEAGGFRNLWKQSSKFGNSKL
jgi:hypothetical protein